MIAKPCVDEDMNKAILLHELGHAHHNHLIKIPLIESIAILASIANYIIFYDHLWIFITILVLERILISYINGQFEYQADLYVAKHQYGEALINYFMNEDVPFPKQASMKLYRAFILQWVLELLLTLTISNWHPSLQSRITALKQYLHS